MGLVRTILRNMLNKSMFWLSLWYDRAFVNRWIAGLSKMGLVNRKNMSLILIINGHKRHRNYVYLLIFNIFCWFILWIFSLNNYVLIFSLFDFVHLKRVFQIVIIFYLNRYMRKLRFLVLLWFLFFQKVIISIFFASRLSLDPVFTWFRIWSVYLSQFCLDFFFYCSLFIFCIFEPL